MKHYTVTRYAFSELEEQAREKAIESYRELLSKMLMPEETEDYLRGRLEDRLGGSADDITIRFSLSYCQGDGVAIYGRLSREEAGNLTWPAGSAYAELSKNSGGYHYSHYKTFNVKVLDDDLEELYLDITTLEKQLRNICRELERDGYKFIESFSSRESALKALSDDDEEVYLIDGIFDLPKGITRKVSA